MKMKLICIAFVTLVCVRGVIAQDKTPFVQHSCVKAAPGQIAGISEMLPDISRNAEVEVHEGRLAFHAVLRTTLPVGSAARCDFMFVRGYEGYPPAPFTRADAEANFVKSGAAGTYDDYLARQRKLWTPVSNDLLFVPRNGIVGSGGSVGDYVRLNLDKLKPGHLVSHWARFEREGWGAYVEAAAKDLPGLGWREEALVSPMSVDYNVMTVDILPSWAATEGDWGGSEVWNQVHPEMKNAEYMAKVREIVDPYKVELYRVVTLVVQK